MGGLGHLAACHLPGGPFGLPSRWAATPNVEVGQTTYAQLKRKGSDGGEIKGTIWTKSQRRRARDGVDHGRGLSDPYSSRGRALFGYYIEKKLHTVYPMLYKPTLKNSKN